MVSEVSNTTNNESDAPCSTPPVSWPTSRSVAFFRSSSSISTSSSSVPLYESPILSPNTPLQFSGIAFSWEQIPGISKKEIPMKKDTQSLLPLPPARNSSEPTRKQTFGEISSNRIAAYYSSKRDPFFVALKECSKDDDDDYHGHGSLGNVWKSLTKSKTDGGGIVGLYTSCKRTCGVSESVVYVPRSRPYNLVIRRSS